MDALTWFKSVFRRALATTPAPLRADVATEGWDDIPLHLAAARLRPQAAPADGDGDDGDWDELIARSRLGAALPEPPRAPPLPPPGPASRKVPSPPPLPSTGQTSRKAPSPPPPPRKAALAPARAIAKPRAPRANQDFVVWGSPKSPAAPAPAVKGDRAASPPLGKAKRALGRASGRAK